MMAFPCPHVSFALRHAPFAYIPPPRFLSAASALGTNMGNCCSSTTTAELDHPDPLPDPKAENSVSQTFGSEISPSPAPPSGDVGAPARKAAVRDGDTTASSSPGAYTLQHSTTTAEPEPSPQGGDRSRSPQHRIRSAALEPSRSVGPRMMMTPRRSQPGSITGAPTTEEPTSMGPHPMATRSRSDYPSLSGKPAPSSPHWQKEMERSRSGYAARHLEDATIGALPNHLQSSSRAPTKADNSRPTLTSTVQEVLSNNFRYASRASDVVQ